ncbi:MAG: sulfite dehydrogenase, partial [Bacillota bacterium]
MRQPRRPDSDESTRNKIDAMIEAEERYLAALRRRSEETGEPVPRMTGRRQFLAAAAAASTGGLLPRIAEAKAPPGAVERDVPPDPTKRQGIPTNDDGGYGSRSQFETETRWRFGTATKESSWTMTPLESGMGIITPSGLHFERHHGGIAIIDPKRHSLMVHGMVERPKKYSVA